MLIELGRITTLSVSLFVLLPFIFCVRFTSVEVEAANGLPVHNIDTGLNYTSIQEAIDAPDTLDGHEIFVEEGTYYEHIVINKSLSITGENRNTTIVDGNGTGTVIIIAAVNVSLVGFTIQGSNIYAMTSGIYASQWTTGSNISHNIVMDNRKGIEFDYYCSNNTVSGNIVVLNQNNGIEFKYFAFNNSIYRNTISNNYGIGIFFWTGGGNNIIENNIVHSNMDEGIKITKGEHMFVNGNWVHNNSLGISLEECSNSHISHNNATDNPGIHLDGINNVVMNNHVLNGHDGIGIGLDSLNNTIINNTILHIIRFGITIGFYCSNNTIQRNEILDCSIGINLERSSINTLLHNNISKNEIGILITGAGNNTILGNTISSSDLVGINLMSTSTNLIIQNNIINNDQQVLVSSYANSWSSKQEGNYWSNYNGSDNNQDGIGDTPHFIAVNNTDHYPLMGMFCDFEATPKYSVQTICNSHITRFSYNGSTINFDATGEDGTIGFCRVCIPTALMNETYRIFVNGTEISHTKLPVSNKTHSYLYFTYDHSTREVVIIPEFPSLHILPLFMLATFLVALVYRRKKNKVRSYQSITCIFC